MISLKIKVIIKQFDEIKILKIIINHKKEERKHAEVTLILDKIKYQRTSL